MSVEQTHYDVVIIGAGIAGLSLARQLLLQSNKTILHLEKAASVPSARQKVGESNVQVAGHYCAKVLDMEEHLFHDHVMKYNLRFMWKKEGSTGRGFEDFGHSYIRKFSNIACYQLDRNKFEGELVRLNRESSRYALVEGADLDGLQIHRGGGHELEYAVGKNRHRATGTWVIDTSGRNRYLANKLGKKKKSEIRHNASFFWTDSVVNIEKLTDMGMEKLRKSRTRQSMGHLPFWLATNHFMGEGFWFWVIPLQHKTSFGLVYDSALVDPREVSKKESLLKWLFEKFPLFERELKLEEMVDFQTLGNYSHDCEQTISEDRWAMSGFAGRFTDPLYSPGGDLIAIYNTLITDAILTESEKELFSKVRSYEMLMKTGYLSFIPSFHHSYDALGDQEAFSMKYVWELSVYFGFYVFPFINGFYCDRLFLVAFMRRFAQLGTINRDLLVFISDFYRWKKGQGGALEEPRFFEFTDVESLNRAESTFYEIGITVDEAIKVLDEQLKNLFELARFLVAHISAQVAGDSELVKSRRHVETIDLAAVKFEVKEIVSNWQGLAVDEGKYDWNLDPMVYDRVFGSSKNRGDGSR